MRARKPFVASAAFLLFGLVSRWSKWNGSAGINAGYPISQWAVSFNGSVYGWPAMIGILAMLAGIIIFGRSNPHSDGLRGLARRLFGASYNPKACPRNPL